MNIAVAGLSRERSFGGSKASATYTFSIFDGVAKTRAEVILADGGFEIIEQRGKDAEVAAKLALERLLLERCAHSRDQSLYESHTHTPSTSRSTDTSTRVFADLDIS